MFKTVILALLFSSSLSFPPKGVDFDNKALQKELLKAVGAEHPGRRELSLAETAVETTAVPGKFFELLEPINSICKYVYIGRVNSCRQGGCSNPSVSGLVETPEYFDYFILFDSTISVVQVKVYNYQATHGQEITAKGWLKQFQGYNGSRSLSVGKTIDAISGATVSVTGITADIQEKTKLLKQLVDHKN